MPEETFLLLEPLSSYFVKTCSGVTINNSLNRDNIVAQMFHCEFKEGEIIFKEEDEAHSFFVLSIFCFVMCVCNFNSAWNCGGVC